MKTSTLSYCTSLAMSITSIVGSILDWFMMKDMTSGLSTVFVVGAFFLAVMGRMMKITGD